MNTGELIRKELESAAFAADDRVQDLRRQLANESDPGRRRALSLKVESAAQEHARCLQALFATPRTL